MSKRLKDPIYGYIDIPIEYTKRVIDTAVFQRLRRVIQTSYAPLYSSAIHNRFVHSIGVFHLGQIAAEKLQAEILEKKLLPQKKVEEICKIYKLACLLHDVGHAPFSHTGEGYYKTDDYKSSDIHKKLVDAVGGKTFKKDIPSEEAKAAAPHEIMSCIIGIKEFGSFFSDSSSKEFFSRCITGYKYQISNKENDIKNCFISMLNSKVIDVDRLDYLIRDAYITGFETVNIDYVRLLSALTIVQDPNDNIYKIAYKKDAISIIENVVYAHDAEKKWIQNHPVVLYECYLIRHIIQHLNEKLNKDNKRLFSPETLSREGVTFEEGIHISLMCDDDIVYLFKNVFPDDISVEFFDREKRRHPVWKSEAEYNAFIGSISSDGRLKDEFQACLKSFVGGNQEDMQLPIIINKELEEKLEKELQGSEKLLVEIQDSKQRNSIVVQQKGTKNRLQFCKYLNKYAEDNGLKDDFIVIRANMFNSNFSKDEIKKVLIVFNSGEKEIISPLSDVCTILEAEGTKEEFYYIYYRSEEGKTIKDKELFCNEIFRAGNGW